MSHGYLWISLDFSGFFRIFPDFFRISLDISEYTYVDVYVYVYAYMSFLGPSKSEQKIKKILGAHQVHYPYSKDYMDRAVHILSIFHYVDRSIHENLSIRENMDRKVHIYSSTYCKICSVSNIGKFDIFKSPYLHFP